MYSWGAPAPNNTYSWGARHLIIRTPGGPANPCRRCMQWKPARNPVHVVHRVWPLLLEALHLALRLALARVSRSRRLRLLRPIGPPCRGGRQCHLGVPDVRPVACRGINGAMQGYVAIGASRRASTRTSAGDACRHIGTSIGITRSEAFEPCYLGCTPLGSDPLNRLFTIMLPFESTVPMRPLEAIDHHQDPWNRLITIKTLTGKAITVRIQPGIDRRQPCHVLAISDCKTFGFQFNSSPATSQIK